jgi:F-type H+-transporting ATPase subunit delta
MANNRLVQKEKIAVYADAMFEAANAAGGQDSVLEVRNQMAELIRIINADMELSGALTNSTYTPEQRNGLVKAVFAECNQALVEVLAVMAENLDADELFKVSHVFENLLKEKLNLCVVDVTTVVPLDDNLRQLIKEKAEADLGCKIELNESIDESLLGGIIMSVNGMRIDASVISQLNNARQVLKRTDGGES